MKQKGKFNYTFVKFLLRALLVIVASFILLNTFNKAYFAKPEGIRIIQQDNEQLASSKYIISEDAVMGKLKQKSQIVSLKQKISKKETYVDDGILGERKTELTIRGSFLMGLDTSSIDITHIDQNTGTIYVKLGKPILISLELPYDQLNFKKVDGFFRLAASESEEKNYYNSTKKILENEIVNDREIIMQANIHNKEVIKDFIMKIKGVNYIIFEE